MTTRTIELLNRLSTEAEQGAPARLAQNIVNAFSQAIVSGELLPGDPMPSEGRIASAFGTSKAIAREAIRDLAAIGIVQIHQGKVAQVCHPGAEPLERFFQFAVRDTRRGLHDAIEMRQIIEPPIARLAAQRCRVADLTRLNNAFAELEEAVHKDGDWISADLFFHETIADLTENTLLSLQVQGLRGVARKVMQFFSHNNPRSEDDWQRYLTRHRRIVTAIANGDGEGAFQAMERHFDEGHKALNMRE